VAQKIERPHWLAGVAVLIAPVSSDNSLQTGNLTGNFAKCAAMKPLPEQNCKQFIRILERIP
jgi:hypothetical protein